MVLFCSVLFCFVLLCSVLFCFPFDNPQALLVLAMLLALGVEPKRPLVCKVPGP